MTRFSIAAYATQIHPLHYAKTWYFVSFAGYACMTPYLPLFYEKWGLTRTEIGAVNALKPLVSFVATPAWGWVADYTGKHNALFFWKTVSQGLGYCALGFFVPKHFTNVFVYIFFLETTCAATMTLADAATGTMCRRASSKNEKPWGGNTYGEIRLWGAVSWGFLFGPAMGAALTYLPTTLANHAPFVVYPIFLAASAATTLGFDFTPFSEEFGDGDIGDAGLGGDGGDAGVDSPITSYESDDEDCALTTATVAPDPSAPGTGSKSKPVKSAESARANSTNSRGVGSKTWAVVSTPTNAATFFAFTLMSASMAVTDTYLFLWMEDSSIGASRLCMGVALGFTCVSEVVLFKNEARIKKHVSTEASIVLILFCYALRQWFYALLPWLSTLTPAGPWVVLPAQLLHGITFGLFWSVGTAFVQKIAPYGQTSSVMGVFGGLNAFGSFSGSVLGGAVFHTFGGGGLFGGIGCLNFALGCVAYQMLISNGKSGRGLRRVGSWREMKDGFARRSHSLKSLLGRSAGNGSSSNRGGWHAVASEDCDPRAVEMGGVGDGVGVT